jgi:mannose/fructose/N-acetylgalactosamine-specific phosphotransferase system component IIC
MIPAYLVTVLLGGVAALDATPVAQTMLSQPLVVATALGAVWGDWRTALEVGIVLQVLAASTLPMGARTPEDYATGGVVGVGLALGLASRQQFVMAREASELLGVLGGVVAAIGGVPLLRWQRRLNEGLSRWCEEEIRSGREGALAASHGAAVVLAFGVGVAYCAVCLGLGITGLATFCERESLRLARAWSLAQPLWLGLGLAQVLHAFIQRRLVRGAMFGAGLIGAWLVLMVGTP